MVSLISGKKSVITHFRLFTSTRELIQFGADTVLRSWQSLLRNLSVVIIFIWLPFACVDNAVQWFFSQFGVISLHIKISKRLIPIILEENLKVIPFHTVLSDSSFLIKIQSPCKVLNSQRSHISSTDQTRILSTITVPKSCKQRVSFCIYTGKTVRDHDWIRRLFFVSTVFELVLHYLLPSSFCINCNQRTCAAFLTAIRYNGWLLYLRPRRLIIFYWVHEHWTAKIPRKVITKNVSGLACLCQIRSRFILKK